MTLRNAPRRPPVRWALCLLPLLAGPAGAVDQLSTVLDTRAEVPGVGTITRVDRVAAAAGGDWRIQVKTNNTNFEFDQVLVGPSSSVIEGTSVAGAVIDGFGPVALDAAGNVFQVLYLAGVGSSDAGLYRNGVSLLRRGDTSTAAGFSAGTIYQGFLNVKVAPSGAKVLLVAVVDDPGVASPADPAVVVLDLDGAGNLVSETVVAKEGVVLPGQGTRRVRAFGTGRQQAGINDAGDVMFFADLEGDDTTDGVIYLNGTILAQEGSVSPDPARNYRSLASRGMDVDETGEWCFTASLDGSTTDDEVLVRNGSIARQENQTLPGVATFFRAQNFGPPNTSPFINGVGDLVWFAQWSATVGNTGVFVADTLKIQKEFTSVEGDLLLDIGLSPDGVIVPDGGSGVYFRGRTGSGPTLRRGVFLLTSGPGAALDAPRPSGEAGGIFLSSGPNPFRGEVQVQYGLDRELPVRLDAYDVRGRLVATLESGVRNAGVHRVSWSGLDAAGRRVAPGVYFLRLRAGEEEFRSRLVKAE